MRSLLVIIGVSIAAAVHGQESVNTSGGEATGSGGSASYTVGQPSYTYASSVDGSVSEGVQQTYQITSSTGIEEENGITLKAYPNPTKDILTLSVEDDMIGSEDLNYTVLDVSGKVLTTGTITGTSEEVYMGKMATGTYFLSVSSSSQSIKTFTINKIK